MLLEPLDDGDCRTLVANLLGRGPLPADAATRIAGAADGNALFAEELLAMLVDDDLLSWDGARWVAADGLLAVPVPTTFHTLLAARLEGLPSDERALLVLASVEGEIFHRSAFRELAPDVPDTFIERSLAGLVRRDVIRPDTSSFADDEAYRFRHLLIRDAAYRSLPKGRRAELHERLADWIERMAAGRLGEYEEIVGYHLERAYRCCLELGSADAELRWLGARASQRLEQAGRRALARGDLPAAIGLLERAASASTDDMSRRAELLPEIAAALIAAGRLPEADWVLDEARLVAARTGDERAAFARARAAAVPRAAARERGRERGGRAGRGAGAPDLRGATTTSTASAAPGDSRPGCTGTRRTPGRRPRPGSRLPPTPAGLPTRARARRSSPGSRRRCGSGRRRWPRPFSAARRFAARSAATSTRKR